MKRYTIILVCAVLGACSGGGGSDSRVIQLPADGPVAEVVNGTPVPQSLLEAVARSRNLHLDKPEQREQALKFLTDMVLVAQAAQREHFDADAQFRADVEAARLKGVAEASVTAFEKMTSVTDDVLKAQYDAEVAKAGKFEYDFSQLLFADEASALTAEQDVVAGKPFQQVFDAWRDKAKQAKTFSRLRADQMAEPIAKALSELKDGDTTKAPIKTEYGWHVVHRDTAAGFTPPPFEQVKETLRRALLVQAGQKRLETLREQAKVQYPTAAAPAKKD